MPARTASRGRRIRTGFPFLSSVPERAGRIPPRTLASRERLEPTRPATPSTSPACSSKLTGSTSGRSSTSARLQHDALAGRLPRRPLADVAPHHEADQLVRRQALDLPRRDDAAVLQHRRAVGEAEDLREPVRDVEDAEAARLELLDDREHALELGAGEDRRRLVEDEDARVERERTGDLDELALGDAEPRDLAAERDLRRRRGRAPAAPAAASPCARGRRARAVARGRGTCSRAR